MHVSCHRCARNWAFLLAALLICLPVTPTPAIADEIHASASFLPIWRLMTPEQRQQFIAGYVYALGDAQKISNLALTLAEEDPQQAKEALQSLKRLYEPPHLKPDRLASAVDEFYADPDNQDAALSAALSAIRAAIR